MDVARRTRTRRCLFHFDRLAVTFVVVDGPCEALPLPTSIEPRLPTPWTEHTPRDGAEDLHAASLSHAGDGEPEVTAAVMPTTVVWPADGSGTPPFLQRMLEAKACECTDPNVLLCGLRCCEDIWIQCAGPRFEDERGVLPDRFAALPSPPAPAAHGGEASQAVPPTGSIIPQVPTHTTGRMAAADLVAPQLFPAAAVGCGDRVNWSGETVGVYAAAVVREPYRWQGPAGEGTAGS